MRAPRSTRTSWPAQQSSKLVAQQVGLSGEQMYAAGPVDAQLARVEQEPTALKRNVEITGETKPYRLDYESRGNLPRSRSLLGSDCRPGRRARQCRRRRHAAIRHERGVGGEDPPRSRVTIRQLGPATARWSMAGSASRWRPWRSSRCSCCGAFSFSSRQGSVEIWRESAPLQGAGCGASARLERDAPTRPKPRVTLLGQAPCGSHADDRASAALCLTPLRDGPPIDR